MYYLTVCRAMQDYARTQKTDTSNDALDDPACIGIRILGYGQHGKCGSQGNKPKRSHSRRFLMQLAIYSNHGSNQHCGTKAKHYVKPAEHGVIPVETDCRACRRSSFSNSREDR
jgi:hypothetical protein